MKVLNMLDYRNMEAYFVKVRSKYLKGKLFEIVIPDHDVILHSTNTLILKNLRDEAVFTAGSRISLIDQYINHRY